MSQQSNRIRNLSINIAVTTATLILSLAYIAVNESRPTTYWSMVFDITICAAFVASIFNAIFILVNEMS